MKKCLLNKKVTSSRAFTIIELMVVVFIIGVLATIVLVTLEKGKVKARDTKRKADLAAISTALERYRADNKKYPASTNQGAFCSLGVDCLTYEIGNYISPIPKDPTNKPYQYRSNGSDYKAYIFSEGIADTHSELCSDNAIKQQAGDFCDPANASRFQVSSGVNSRLWD